MDSTWSFCEFMDQYNELYQWLNEIQIVIYSSPKNITDRRLREVRASPLVRFTFRLQEHGIWSGASYQCSEVPATFYTLIKCKNSNAN